MKIELEIPLATVNEREKLGWQLSPAFLRDIKSQIPDGYSGIDLEEIELILLILLKGKL